MKLYLPDGTLKSLNEEAVTILSLLDDCGINPLEVIVTKNGRLVPEDAVASGSDEIKIFRVAHGG
jgi:sulfur carrier protein